jgi:HEAT repeat protein
MFDRSIALQQLKSKKADKRLKAIHYLSSHNDKDLWNLMTNALGDSDPNVQEALIEVLGTKFGKKALDYLIANLDDRHLNVRKKAVDMIVQLGPNAIPALIKTLAGKTLVARINAVVALGNIGGPEVLEVLFRSLDDASPEVSWESALALEKNAELENVIARLSEQYPQEHNQPGVAYLLAQYGEPAVLDKLQQNLSSITVLLSDNQPAQRLAAVKTLDVLGGDRAVELLLQMISDPDEQVIIAVGKALARRGDPAKIQANWSEWKTKNPYKQVNDEETVQAFVAVKAALNSDELLVQTQDSSDKKPDNIRANLEAQLNKLIDRYAPDTFGG